MKQYLTVSDLCAELDCSKDTVSAMVRNGLPVSHLIPGGRAYRVLRAELDEYLRRNQSQAAVVDVDDL
jgi:excisionase family DNA binding protein